jgi:hypothetical protein
VEQANKLESGIAIIDSQCAANSDYTGSFPICRRNLADQCVSQG